MPHLTVKPHKLFALVIPIGGLHGVVNRLKIWEVLPFLCGSMKRKIKIFITYREQLCPSASWEWMKSRAFAGHFALKRTNFHWTVFWISRLDLTPCNLNIVLNLALKLKIFTCRADLRNFDTKSFSSKLSLFFEAQEESVGPSESDFLFSG